MSLLARPMQSFHHSPGSRSPANASFLLCSGCWWRSPYAAVCLVILYRRYAEGAHNPLLGEESERLRVHCRVMQNTLEQLLWFTLCLLALSTFLSPSQMRLVPILCVFFALARFVYWLGYLRAGTLGRAPGVQLTFLLNIPLLMATLALFARSLWS